MPRLDLLVAKTLGVGRRQATRLLRAGRVADADGARLDDAKRKIGPSELPVVVRVDDVEVVLRDRAHVLQHKPLGTVTARHDARHPTAYEKLRTAPLFRELRAVGRLDLDTSGLLLWTTDGTLLHRLTHPSYAVPRTYHAALRDDFSPAPEDLVLDDGHRPTILALHEMGPDSVHPALSPDDRAKIFASITIIGGRFHEVRRIFRALGTEVLQLARVDYGGVTLPVTLAAGDFLEIDLSARFRGLSPQR